MEVQSLVSTVNIAKTRKTVFHMETYINYILITRPPDKSVQLKIIFLISQPKHMLWYSKEPS